MLEKVDLFAELPGVAIQSLEQYAKTYKYPRNAIILTEGEPCNNFYIVKSGKVRVFVDSEKDKQIVLDYLQEGSYFGELGIIDGEARSASVSAMQETELVAISRDDFQNFLDEHQSVALIMMRALVKRIRRLTSSVRDIALLDVYGRVSNLLLDRAGDEGEITPKLTHQEIADMIGASREMVSRIMRELALGGYIEQLSATIKVNKSLPRNW